jgi:hypothetical protein
VSPVRVRVSPVPGSSTGLRGRAGLSVELVHLAVLDDGEVVLRLTPT